MILLTSLLIKTTNLSLPVLSVPNVSVVTEVVVVDFTVLVVVTDVASQTHTVDQSVPSIYYHNAAPAR